MVQSQKKHGVLLSCSCKALKLKNVDCTLPSRSLSYSTHSVITLKSKIIKQWAALCKHLQRSNEVACYSERFFVSVLI